MNTSEQISIMYESIPAVAELNRVPGFEPFKLLRRIVSPEEGKVALQLDLRFKKLWFRLAHPKGRIRLNPLRITEQMAIFEAQVYLDRGDENPVGSFTSCCTKEEAPGGQYVQAAQFEAMDEALTDAGFGVQFADVSMDASGSRYGSRILLPEDNAAGNAVTVSHGVGSAEKAEANRNAGRDDSAGKSSPGVTARNTESVHGKENITQRQKAEENVQTGMRGQTAQNAQAVEPVEKTNPVSAAKAMSDGRKSALTASVGNRPAEVQSTASVRGMTEKPAEADLAPAMAAHESLPVQAAASKGTAAQQPVEIQEQKVQGVGTARAFHPVLVQGQAAKPVVDAAQPAVGANTVPPVAMQGQIAQSAVKANNAQSVMVSGKGATSAGEKKAVQAGSAGIGRKVVQKSASQSAGNGKPLQVAQGQKQPAVQSEETSLPVQPQAVRSQSVQNKTASADALPVKPAESYALPIQPGTVASAVTAGNELPIKASQSNAISAQHENVSRSNAISTQPENAGNATESVGKLPAEGKRSAVGETKSSVQGAMALLSGQNFRTVQTGSAGLYAAGLPAGSSMSASETQSASRNMTTSAVQAASRSMAASVAQPAGSSMSASAAQPTDQLLPASGSVEQGEAVSCYTPDMPVEEIVKLMTFEEAEKVVVDIGVCKGMTMAEVAERRPPSLKFYLYGGDKGNNNILRAAAQIMLDSLELQKAG